MDNLLRIGFSQEYIDSLFDKFDEQLIYTLDFNYENTYKLVTLYNKMGVEDVYELLYSNIGLFLMDFDEVIEKLKNVDLKEFPERIMNPDYVDEIFG